MQAAPLAPDEEQRLFLLQALDLLDTPSEPAFDLITRMTANAIGVPIALVSLIDRDRQWFKSKVGMGIAETPREYAFCAHCIVGGERLLVPDATQDERFFDNPLVCGAKPPCACAPPPSPRLPPDWPRWRNRSSSAPAN